MNISRYAFRGEHSVIQYVNILALQVERQLIDLGVPNCHYFLGVGAIAAFSRRMPINAGDCSPTSCSRAACGWSPMMTCEGRLGSVI